MSLAASASCTFTTINLSSVSSCISNGKLTTKKRFFVQNWHKKKTWPLHLLLFLNTLTQHSEANVKIEIYTIFLTSSCQMFCNKFHNLLQILFCDYCIWSWSNSYRVWQFIHYSNTIIFFGPNTTIYTWYIGNMRNNI